MGSLLASRVLRALRLAERQPAQLLSLRSLAARPWALSSGVEDGDQQQPGASDSGEAAASSTEAAQPGADDLSARLEGAEGEDPAEAAPGSSYPDEGEEDFDAPLDEEEERDMHLAAREALDDLHAQLLGDGEELEPVINLAGAGRSGWENVWHGEEDDRWWWALDLTGGKVPENGRNALLCHDSKVLMRTMHEQGVPTGEIAAFFRVRQQRVLAILALQKLDEQWEAAGLPPLLALQRAMEGGGPEGEPGVFDCSEVVGSGERHVRLLPRAPHYEVGVDAEGNLVRRDMEAAEEAVAAAEDATMIAEFRERLLFNMRETGKGLNREARGAHRPRRPRKGFGLLVRPKGGGRQPFVAEPDGSRRELNEDEAELQRRRRIRPRRRFM